MTRFAPRLMVLLLCGAALCGCATVQSGIDSVTGGATPDPIAASNDAAKDKLAKFASSSPGDLDSSIHQAQLARLAGQYDQAVHILSQLMLVASDDPRVVGEYGKTLAEQGRASEAQQFLSRASELSPSDWTLYSAVGVADDQLGDQAAARLAYEHALALKPGEPSVLNNYALSRMLANDPDGAHTLIARAKIAGGASDPKIARNIALIEQMAPMDAAPQAQASAAPKPAPAMTASAHPTQQPITIPPPPAIASASTAAPRPLVMQQAPVTQQNLPAPQLAMQAPQPSSPYAPYQAVVMQRVPVDPLAGPVKPAAHAPHPIAASHVADATAPDAKGVAIAKPVIAKAEPVKATAKDTAPAKTAEAKPDAKSAKAKNAVPALRMTADARNP